MIRFIIATAVLLGLSQTHAATPKPGGCSGAIDPGATYQVQWPKCKLGQMIAVQGDGLGGPESGAELWNSFKDNPLYTYEVCGRQVFFYAPVYSYTDTCQINGRGIDDTMILEWDQVGR